MKEIVIPLCHHSAFMAHGPGRGSWWAWQSFDAGVARNDRVVFVLKFAVPRYLSRLEALVLHVETPKGVRDCERLGIPPTSSAGGSSSTTRNGRPRRRSWARTRRATRSRRDCD